MKLFGPSVQEAIDADVDMFGRDALAAGLLKLFSECEDPLVVALDEKWGTGKTVFAKRLEKKAKAAGFTVVYFDAFKRDYDPDVFVSLAASLLAQIPSRDANKSFKSKAKKVGLILGRVALKSAVRVSTGGLASVSDFGEAADGIEDDIGGVVATEIDKIIEHRLSNATTDDQTFNSFRAGLSGLVQDGGEGAKGVLFIIDELDRCRPNYALEVLETAKHLFSAPNVHFLLVCQMEQLVASVSKAYGSGVDADRYLEKFLTNRIHFPVLRKEDYYRRIMIFIDRIMQGYSTDERNMEFKSEMTEFLSRLATRKRYSLRQIERTLTQFGLCLAFTKPNVMRLGAIVFVLCDLKQNSPRLFQKAKNGTLKYDEIQGLYDFQDDEDDWYIKWLRYFYDPTIELGAQEWVDLTRSLHNNSTRDRLTLALHFANGVVDNITA